ncbi:MAG TPA: metalloregulator ArsR/SmtB family transcription factor [Bauldia sp.]|nr:metalloregulator ArsR/SmtB family transcription factor [Bauldia sp.]
MARASAEDRLDEVFHALANRTRRKLVKTLAGGPARVSDLAGPYRMSLNAISKHLFVLERAGLIRREKSGAVQTCVLEAGAMASADAWIADYRRFWDGQIDALAAFVEKKS